MKMETKKNLISATLVITIVSSLLYVAGSAFNSTYLHTFGIAPKIFQYDLQTNLETGGDVLYVGWFIISLVGFIYSFIALFLIWMLHELSKDQLIKKITNFLSSLFKRKKRKQKQVAPLFLSKSLRICLFVCLMFCLAGIISQAYIKMVTFSSNLAKDQALAEISQLTNQPEKQNELEFTINGVKETGYLITSDKENIAIFCTDETNNKSFVRIIRRNNVTNIQKEYIPD